jgi:hypothetical protein
VRVVLISGVGHFLMMENPASFNRVLGETIERLEAVPATEHHARYGVQSRRSRP